MFELTDIKPKCDVQEAEYQRLLGYPAHHSMEGRARELADGTRKWFAQHGRPWIFARQMSAVQLSDNCLCISGTEFRSPHLRDLFTIAEADSAVLVIVSAGAECEARARQLWQEGKPDEYFFLEMYGSAVVEHLLAAASGGICAWADQQGMAALPHYSPGYSGWNVSEQLKLWELVRPKNGCPLPGQLEVLETGMLRPKKSQIALVGLTRQIEKGRLFARLVPCENCSLLRCQYRRAPYRHALPQIEDVRRLQPELASTSLETTAAQPGLDHAAKYSTNLKALRKWADELLQMKLLPDGSIEARFRYEGTTCTSLGRTLAMEHHLTLSPREDGYRIQQAICQPAPGDTGHTAQCQYLADSDSFMQSLASEIPLLSRPLNDVLEWQRSYSPSGCYCDAAQRAHKWKLALEVIHFALVQREGETEAESLPRNLLLK